MTRSFVVVVIVVVAAPERLEEHDTLQIQTQPDVQREGHLDVVAGDASTQLIW